LGLSGSALAWFACLAMPFTRYLFWAMLPGCIFVAAAFYQWTGGYDLKHTVRQATGLILRRQFTRQALAALMVVVILAVELPFLAAILTGVQADRSAYDAAEYIAQNIPPGWLVEGYDSEVFFLIDHPYHFPPDAVHVALVRRAELGSEAPVEYDPLAADPDILMVGPLARYWRLYDEVIQSGAFELLWANALYEVYQRVR
jgi:hypothetical protein